MDDFAEQMGKVMPQIPKNQPQGKNDFKTIRELFEYIIDEDEKTKKRASVKAEQASTDSDNTSTASDTTR